MALSLISVAQDPDTCFSTGIYQSGRCQIFALRLESYGLVSTVAFLAIGPRIEEITKALSDVTMQKPEISGPLHPEDQKRIVEKIQEMGMLLGMTEAKQAAHLLNVAFPGRTIAGVPGGITSIQESDKDQMDKSGS